MATVRDRALPWCWSTRVCVDLQWQRAWWRGVSAPPGLMTRGLQQHRVTLCNARAQMSVHKCHGCRESDACPGSLVPPRRAPLAALPLSVCPGSSCLVAEQGAVKPKPSAAAVSLSWGLWSCCHPGGTSRAGCVWPDHRVGGEKWSISLKRNTFEACASPHSVGIEP